MHVKGGEKLMLVSIITFIVLLVYVHNKQADDDFGPVKKPEPLLDQSEFDDMIARYIGGADS